MKDSSALAQHFTIFNIIRDLTEEAEKRARCEKYVKQFAIEDEGIAKAMRNKLRQQDQALCEPHIQTREATEQ